MRTYVAIVSVIAALYLSGALAAALILDPTAAHPGTHIDSLRPYRAISDARNEKYTALRDGDHKLLIFGSSRTWRGINPDSVKERFPSGYNAGVPGTNYKEMPYIVDRALEFQSPEAVVFEASLHMFKADVPLSSEFERSGFNPKRSLEAQLVDIFGFLPIERAAAILWRLVRDDEAVRKTDVNGTLLGFYGPRDYRLRFEISIRNDMRRPERFADFELDEARVQALVDAARQAKEGGAKVYIVFPPIHALLIEGMREAGAIDDYYTLIREVVAELGDVENVQIWDMSAYYPVQQEPVPTDGQTPMINYADPSHFTTEVGGCILTTLFEPDDSRRTDCGEFGTLLTPANVEDYLSRFESKHVDYCESNAEHCAWVHELYIDGFNR